MSNGCSNSCLLNAVAGLKNGAWDHAFCLAQGQGTPGLIFPVPFSMTVLAGASDVVEIDPLNDGGAVPFAMLIDDDPVTGAPPTVTIDEIKNGAGDVVGLKGAGISTSWPIGSFNDMSASERIKAGLPNLPPNIGLIDSTKKMSIAFTNTASGAPLTLEGIVFVVIPRSTPSV